MAKIGDMVRILDGSSAFYAKGTKGKIVSLDEDGDAWIDFKAGGNEVGTYDDAFDGILCSNTRRFEVIKDAPVEAALAKLIIWAVEAGKRLESQDHEVRDRLREAVAEARYALDPSE